MTEGEGEQVGSEYSHLGGGSDQQQPWLGDQRREIRHGSDSEEYERWVPTLLDSLVQNIQYGAVLMRNLGQELDQEHTTEYPRPVPSGL